MNENLVAYAMDFASFLLQEMGRNASYIRHVLLFGSAARGDAGKESDIDIFVDVLGAARRVEKKVENITNKFYSSKKFTEYWRLLGIENEIKCNVGKLDEWKELKPSIVANGMVLYGKYEGNVKGENMVLMHWGKVKPESKRVLLSKKLYGYRYKDREYEGILGEASGTKLGANCIIIPVSDAQKILDIFKNMGISVKALYISQYK